MCGIAGVLATSGMTTGDARARLETMRDAQQHRGPDDSGVMWSDALHAGIAASRLAIRDLSPAGHMPMCVDDVWIAYNGEVYNADALRSELAGRGHSFKSHSDTEVILRGYLTWGEDVVHRLRGMFAFGILDTRRQQLVLARDPLGIKPLYYTQRGAFAFASELRAFVNSRAIEARIDETALSAYLQLGSIPAPLTVYADVAALRPGHIATLPIDDPRKISVRGYWPAASSKQTSVADVEAALFDAVRSHLVSDVPVGAFLSGGLDSSSVVAIAAPQASEQLRTCSIAFESAAHNEAIYARAVAKAFGTDHYERVVTRDDFMRALPTFFDVIDQPSIDGFNTYFVSETARQAGLTVALSGLGGDELFGGYPSFDGVPRLMRALKVARAAGGVATRALTTVARSDRWRKVAAAAGRPVTAASSFLVYRGLFTRAEVETLLPNAQHFDAEAYVAERAGPAGGAIKSWVSRAELGTYTASQLLRDCDVTSMAHSLELRVPLLDTRLVEAVHALPPEQRFVRGRNKALLRDIMAKRLPAVVLERRDRQGFSFPMREWLGNAIPQRFDAPAMQRFNQRALADVSARFRSGHTHWSRIWSLMALNEWSRRTSAHA
jgi:asparagine synthase (glutamine-hydrolysing)